MMSVILYLNTSCNVNHLPDEVGWICCLLITYFQLFPNMKTVPERQNDTAVLDTNDPPELVRGHWSDFGYIRPTQFPKCDRCLVLLSRSSESGTGL